MKRVISNLLIAGVIFGSIGCEQSDILTLPDPDAALSFNSIGYNSQPWRARIAPVRGILDKNQFLDVKNAVIKIYENGIFMESLIYGGALISPDFDTGSPYWGTTKPKPGKTYKVIAEAPGYPSIISEFVQPDSISVEFFEVRNLGKRAADPVNFWGSDNMEFTLRFTDPPGANYYEVWVEAFGDSIYTSPTETGVVRTQELSGLPLTFVDPAYQQASQTFGEGALAFDDSFFEGKTVQFYFTSILPIPPPGYPLPDSYTIYIRNISKEYYQHLKTTALQDKTTNDPYAQPVLIENNIKDGYGIFGGITESSKIIPAPHK